mmetsp:Transcript_55454/g.135860  ORF Transcript_55454/g.135860 Transcript_55454/m.135860 type:complete len:153 (+) Transcript_55454:858-1316(+)
MFPKAGKAIKELLAYVNDPEIERASFMKFIVESYEQFEHPDIEFQPHPAPLDPLSARACTWGSCTHYPALRTGVTQSCQLSWHKLLVRCARQRTAAAAAHLPRASGGRGTHTRARARSHTPTPTHTHCLCRRKMFAFFWATVATTQSRAPSG